MKDRASFAMNLPSLESSPVPVRERIQRLLELGDRELARAHFEAALDHYREAHHLADESSGRAMSLEEASRLEARSARCLLRLGRPAEALQAIETAASLAGEPEAARLLDLEIAIQWGEVYAELGDYRRAEEHAAAAEHAAGR
jgi:tetratricopeptide (TPR) repeat protein